MTRTLVQRIHNPHGYECGCSAACWCRRTLVGRAVKWWFPARWFGIHHRNVFSDGMTAEETQAWKLEQEQRGMTAMAQRQPRYETIVRLGPNRFGMTVRGRDGGVAIHELGGRLRPEENR